MLFMAGPFIVHFVFVCLALLGLILEGKRWYVMYSLFYLKRSCGYCGGIVMQYGHLNQFTPWQVHCDQGTETSNLQ